MTNKKKQQLSLLPWSEDASGISSSAPPSFRPLPSFHDRIGLANCRTFGRATRKRAVCNIPPLALRFSTSRRLFGMARRVRCVPRNCQSPFNFPRLLTHSNDSTNAQNIAPPVNFGTSGCVKIPYQSQNAAASSPHMKMAEKMAAVRSPKVASKSFRNCSAIFVSALSGFARKLRTTAGLSSGSWTKSLTSCLR